MAFARRAGGRPEPNTWPGFVDALTALLLILMFVLSIFMIVQFTMNETITGQSKELDKLNQQISGLADELSLQKTRAQTLKGQVGELRATLTAKTTEVDQLNAAMAALSHARDQAQARAQTLQGKLDKTVSARDALEAALASARKEMDAATEKARLAAAKRDALQAMVANLQDEAKKRKQALTQVTVERARALALVDQLQSQKATAETEREKLAQERVTLLAMLQDVKGDKQKLQEEMARLETKNLSLEQQRKELNALRAAAAQNLTEAQTKLSQSEQERLAQASAVKALREKLAHSSAELDAMTLALEEARKQAEQTLTMLAAARVAKQDLQGKLDARASQMDREEALRRVAESELSKAKDQTLEQQRRVAALNAQLLELRNQLGSLQSLLDDYKTRDSSQKIKIADLGARLNQALARKVSELSRYQSVFFEKMDKVLGGRKDIKRVGDRFVFQSEVLFAPGSAQLRPQATAELDKLGEVLRSIVKEVPKDLPWILRVDGHTDKRPIASGSRYHNNWELSTARAVSVVEYLIDHENVPPKRLAAAGFGQYQPVALGDSPEALAKNRRIEFKFTER